MSPEEEKSQPKLKIGLALSGGGSRAIAFHLGCMRALHDRGLLDRVSVLSTVSGGSVIGAIYAYSNESFEEFETKIENLLSKGLMSGIIESTLFSSETFKILLANVTAGSLALLGRLINIIFGAFGIFGFANKATKTFTKAVQAPMPRFASRTTAFASLLDKTLFFGRTLSQVEKDELQVIINATELRTETAFRYGSVESGSWRFGKLIENVPVAKAVAASAAFPGSLPALDEIQKMSKNGETTKHRTIITDGGIYDNLGTSCLVPNRNPEFSTNINDVDFIIACIAGHGIPDGSSLPYFWGSRMLSTLNTIHRRTHTMTFSLLHQLRSNGEIKGFILPYLGQQDERLPCAPSDLVSRDEVFGYPTDFNPMSREDIRKLSLRGEQLTRNLIETYHPDL